MTTVSFIDSTEKVRALSEHRAPKKFLNSVPFVPASALQPAPPIVPLTPDLDDLRALETFMSGARAGQPTLAARLWQFKGTEPGSFTSPQFAGWLKAAGHPAASCDSLISIAKSVLRRFENRGLLEKKFTAGSRSHHAADIWRFT